MSATVQSENFGKVKQILGPVVDVEFENGHLPPEILTKRFGSLIIQLIKKTGTLC